MSKTVAIWGSPNSGKTTFAVKLAQAIYNSYKCKVVVLLSSLETPTIPVIFPNYKLENISSVGIPLSKTEYDLDELLRHIILLKNKVDIGFIGYKHGENKNTYPRYDENKARDLIHALGEIVDYVIIDCDSNLDGNILSEVAVTTADEVIRLASPDLKCISWYLSQKAVYSDAKYGWEKHIQGLNIPYNDVFAPVEDSKSHLKEVSFTLPFSRSVKEQMQRGTLYEASSDKKFNKIMTAIATKVAQNDSD